MRKLRIRTYFLLSLVLFLSLPWIFFVAAHFITTQSLHIGGNRPDSYTVHMVAAFAGLLLAFFLVGVRMRKLLLMPLERMSQAARKIAEGDLDVQLPQSTIREVAEVRDGFEVMVNGLQSAHQKQAELEEERRFVIAAVAHDLRTPLFALRGYLDGLEQGIARTPEQAAKYVAVCKEKSAQLDRLVEDLFAFTKIEYRETELSENTADLHDIVQKSIDSLEPQAQQKHISILAHYGMDDCVIRGDAHLLERAISNLLDNAVRYTPAYGRILVQCRRKEDRAAFTIRDSGPGFGPEELRRIFEPLYRGEQSRNRATGGAGLGLTISQRIIHRHGGELVAGNHPDGGAILTVWLPADNR
ncbi:HAMP domain-containing histidine kinase [Brevibacillus ruminantium]|uniref:histidine kinase n=1 Tax=Brevibacillus ruminantium TaxID=2950604 RepID=A0ABY4WI36_9BACL|nr:HAMP domain-containing sensor histidine kinase [Brevibacillus ruminantium]USG65813.1 HAMP domain-containing histidine kinase [Brevibacillus ruminantium]